MENRSDFFSSLIKATKTYVGDDPLLPWLQGIQKIKEALPPEVVNQKLPRFLEKCTQHFQNDRHYRNDLRYLQLWIQMLEYVPNRGEVLSVMERHKIGLKHALYYKAYALHYEKLKKFSDAEAMYKLGIQRLAEPAESLEQSYDSFLQRMVHRNGKLKSKKAQATLRFEEIQAKGHRYDLLKSNEELGIKGGEIESESFSEGGTILTYSDKCTVDVQTSDKYVHRNGNLFNRSNLLSMEDKEQNKGKVNSEGESSITLLGTVVSAPSLVSDSSCQDTIGSEESLHCEHAEEVRDTYHRPFSSTVNTKEVKLSINCVDESIRKNPCQAINGTKPAVENFKISPSKNLKDHALNEQLVSAPVPADLIEQGMTAVEENESGIQEFNRLEELAPVKDFEALKDAILNSSQEQTSKDDRAASLLLKDCEDLSGTGSRENKDSGGLEEIQSQKPLGECSDSVTSIPSKFPTEETVIIRKFVDSTIVGDTQQVEDAYHHGLIEPTINTKEAMADINNMFGKPLKFEKPKSVNQAWKMQTTKQPVNSFQVLVDEDLKASEGENLINPLEKDMQVFVNEIFCYNSSAESVSSKNISPLQELPILADIKGSQHTVKDQGFSSVLVEFYQDGISIIEKNVKNSIEKNGYRQFGSVGEMNVNSKFCSEDTILIRKFVDSAIVGDNKELEVSFHHGLVDPTVNTKEAMEEINMMFLKPLQFDQPKSKKQPPSAKTFKPDKNFQIFSDEVLEEQGVKQGCFVNSLGKTHDSSLSCINDLEIFVDENLMCDPLKEIPGTLNSSEDFTSLEDGHIPIDGSSERMQEKTLNKCSTFQNRGPSIPPLQVYQDRQFPPADNLSLKTCNEDTIVIRKIVDSTLADTEIEDACHHGLVEPTINTKEAMADINDMFRQSFSFDYPKRSSLTQKAGTSKHPCKGPWILTDEDMKKEDLEQQVLLPDNTGECNSSVRAAKDFQFIEDENGDCIYSNTHKMKSHLSGDNVPVPVLSNNDNSLDIQKKSSILFEKSKAEDVCKPAGCFEVFIDEQFHE